MRAEGDLARQDWQADILGFWFRELTPADWFGGAPDVDEKIKSRFADLPDELSKDIPAATQTDARAALAAIIVLDQFPRNLFRRTAKAFAFDGLAIEIARNATAKELDAGLGDTEKQFLYMPFMHSEILADQERGVDLFRSLGMQEAIDYAIEHRDIIARFGRFPHRNKALGRTSTDAETEFLKTHAGFGQ